MTPRGSELGRSVRSSATLASFLSFLLPGLGQLLTGAWRRGVLFALPILALLGAAAVAWLVDRPLVVRAALSPGVLLAVVALSLAMLAYRCWAIVDAYRVSRRRWGAASSTAQHAASLLVVVILLAATAYAHGWVAYLGWNAHQTLAAVFAPGGPDGLATPAPSASLPSGSATSTPAAPTAAPTPTASPTPEWAADGRLNVLLIGSDAGPGRWSMRADAIILVSIEISSGRVAAFSLPRYTLGVPLPEPAASAFTCRCAADQYANALYVYANQHPELFPGGDDRGLLALSGMAEALFGVHLDGMAVADLNGFVGLVDAIGGIDVNVPQPVYDAKYRPPNGGPLVAISFAAGRQHLDGWHALAYARTRHQDGDFNRMKRQQLVVQAIGHELRCDPLGDLPAVLDVARTSLWTNLPLDDVPDMLRIDAGPVESHLLFDVYNPVLTPADWARVASEVAHAFDGPPPKVKPGSGCSAAG
ncbi:MAG TPA: LCP family protein [Candidatus Limnocylindria bacterium]|nr:LCP family protein [Candidatus Limnocylindria bacterium]